MIAGSNRITTITGKSCCLNRPVEVNLRFYSGVYYWDHVCSDDIAGCREIDDNNIRFMSTVYLPIIVPDVDADSSTMIECIIHSFCDMIRSHA